MSSLLGMTDDLCGDSPSGQGRQDVNRKEVLTLTYVSNRLEEGNLVRSLGQEDPWERIL